MAVSEDFFWEVGRALKGSSGKGRYQKTPSRGWKDKGAIEDDFCKGHQGNQRQLFRHKRRKNTPCGACIHECLRLVGMYTLLWEVSEPCHRHFTGIEDTHPHLELPPNLVPF